MDGRIIVSLLAVVAVVLIVLLATGNLG